MKAATHSELCQAKQGTTHTIQSYTIMHNDTQIDANGGTYYVVSAFGWASDKNPFRAFMKLAEHSYITGSFPKAKDYKSNGELCKRADTAIFVYYVADDSKVKGLNWFRPVDENNKPLGTLIYGGDDNCQLIAKLCNPATSD